MAGILQRSSGTRPMLAYRDARVARTVCRLRQRNEEKRPQPAVTASGFDPFK